MTHLYSHILFGIVLSSLLISPITMSFTNNNDAGEEKNNTDTFDVVDVPTWAIGDTWTFQAAIYSNTENGVFDIYSDSLVFSVENRTILPTDTGLVDVYLATLTGEIAGTFENSTISGEVTGDITGQMYIRQADLSLLDVTITSSGIIEWLFFDFDYEMNSASDYTPSFEYFDFPIQTNENWMSQSTVHQNTSIYIENLFNNQTETTEEMMGNVSCTHIENITVPAGNFTSHHIISDDNESKIESWYNTTIKNIVRLYLFQENDTSLNIVNLNLTSCNLQSQQMQVSMNITPSIAAVGDLVTISGFVMNDDIFIQDVDITVSTPSTGETYSTTTDTNGMYMVTFNAPFLLDPTPTTYDIGSDGILVTAEYDGAFGYNIRTLTLNGITIQDITATPEIQNETKSVNITCSIHSVETLDSCRVNISGPAGYITQNQSLFAYNDISYYFCQNYSIIGKYNYYIWVMDESGNKKRSSTCSFNIISGNQSVDVNQSVYDHGFPIRHAVDGDWAAAQDFSPTIGIISAVDLYLRKFGTPEFDLTVELREDHPQGTLLDTVTFNTLDVGTSWGWLHFGYEWAYAFGDQYPDGSFWFTRDGGCLWRDLPTIYEFAFRTYGY